MKKIILMILITLLLTLSVVADEHDFDGFDDNNIEHDSDESDFYEDEFNNVLEEDLYDDIGDVELEGDAGITPDSVFYGFETFIENILVGNNPETALKYKEEKILELKAMIDAGDEEGALKALERLEKFNPIIKKEASPDIEKRVRSSSKAVKKLLNDLDLDDDLWDDVRENVDDNLKEEDRIALAAKISNKIADLCKALSSLDPLEYSKICSTGDDDPEWKKDLDRELTGEQRKEAELFFEIMSQCFENPAECRCDDISIKPFAEQCGVIAPLAAECESGDEAACEEMENAGDPIDLLPPYLQDVMDKVEDRYGEAKHDLHIPSECEEVGATSREACMEVMFKLHAPEECQEALERGEIDVSDENSAREDCDRIMFELEAPDECRDVGLTDHQECERFMFKLDNPECVEAGLTGSGRDDYRKCDAIRFKLDAPEECLDAGIDGSGRDDWKKCGIISFKLEASQECLDAGLTGEGRNDWDKCNTIQFKLDNPECVTAGISGEGRDDWRKCDAITFKEDAAQECLDAGLDGTGRHDWDECNKITFLLDAPEECHKFAGDRDPWRSCEPIKFKLDAPQECLDAGIDGTGRRDWDKCNDIMDEFQDENQEEYDDGDYEDYPDKYSDESYDCAVLNCGQNSYCDPGRGCVENDNFDDDQESDDFPEFNDEQQDNDDGTDSSDDFENSNSAGSAIDPGFEDSNFKEDDHMDDSSDDDSGRDESESDSSDSGSDDSGSDSDEGSSDSGSDDSGDDGGDITGSAIGIFSSAESRFWELSQLFS